MMKPYIVGNWKMNLDAAEGAELAGKLLHASIDYDTVDVGVAPAFPVLYPVKQTVASSKGRLAVVAQNVSAEEKGAFTGESSISMLKSVGVTSVIIGHSERRQIFGETDQLINKKVRLTLSHGLDVILCVGETLFEREADSHFETVTAQVAKGLKDVPVDKIEQVTVAYEPVWAIGTGVNASPSDAQAMHFRIREMLKSLYGPVIANKLRILYGGSVKPDNAKGLMNQPDINGALVGGASLKPEDFLGIINSSK
ncbi:MAG TPA: triose-phosphate isomerase [Deferribacteraceae bacterium]|jgi:triosephosphate isomerase|nr:triose-phosphate isomerase [Deferribacteraceae bacterium]